MDLAALCDNEEEKMVPMDAIWLFLVKIQPLAATSWLLACTLSSHPVRVLVILAMPVKII